MKRDVFGDYGFVRYALTFDPSKSPHYKVVCVTHEAPASYKSVERKRAPHRIDIYSSDSGKWKYIKVPFFPSPSERHRDYDRKKMPMHFDYRSTEGAIYCNGAVHWIRDGYGSSLPLRQYGNGKPEFGRQECDVLHYFDIGQERLMLVSPTPPVPMVVKNIPISTGMLTEMPYWDHRYFGESGGHLYLIESYRHCMSQFDVMEMERDYSGWFVKYHVDLNPVFTALQDSNAFVVLYLSGEEEEVSSCDLWLHMPGKVMSYNLSNKTFKTSIELANKELFLGLYDQRFPYMVTSASV